MPLDLEADEPVKTASVADDLANAIRALVREELNQPPTGPPAQRPPKWKDAFWLLVLICDIVLFITLIPEDLWSSPLLEEIGKLLPWIGGGTFVLGTMWFRERLLEFSRGRGFKIITALAFFALFLLHLPIIPLQPVIAPAQSHLLVDGVRKIGNFGDGETRIWVKAGGHSFKIVPDEGGTALTREIEWSCPHLLRMWLTGLKPRWGIVYSVPIITDGQGSLVRISKSDSILDTDFEDELLTRVGNVWEFRPVAQVDQIRLPYGDYSVSVEKEHCTPLKLPALIRVGFDSDAKIELNDIMKCSK
jgi:hypothetical protein